MKKELLLTSVFLVLTACGGNFEITDLKMKEPKSAAANNENNDITNDTNISTISGASSLNKNNCQSDSLCVHPDMPLYSQADGSSLGTIVNGQYQLSKINVNGGSVPLLQYVQNKGHNITRDPGWCGAVSFAMALKTWTIEANIQSADLRETDKWMVSKDSSEFIYNVMGFIGMRPELGVSTPEAHSAVFSKLLNFSKGNVKLSNDIISTSTYRNEMKNPIMTIGMGSKSGGGHLVAVNGTDAQYYVINDPWGATYSVSFAKGTTEKTKPDGSKYYDYSVKYIGSGIKTLQGISSGFVPQYNDINGLIGVNILSNYR